MWPQVTLTLLFRGLLVIHRVETVQPNFFEVGVVPDEHHFLRIHTIKDGVLAATKFLEINPNRKKWSLEVDFPAVAGVAAYKRGQGQFKRDNDSDERDYRWITELGEIYGGVQQFPNKIDTSRFLPVVKIPNGMFYTRLKSPILSKVTNDQSVEFGSIAAVVAVDIPLFGGQARLIEHNTQENTTEEKFLFEPDGKTMYEFANTPCDVPAHANAHAGPHHEHGPCEGNHFSLYCKKLFRNPDEEPSICFVEPRPQPAPDPAVCGAAGGDGIKDPFLNP